MKTMALAVAAGLACAINAAAQPGITYTSGRIFGNTFGEGTNTTTQQQLTLTGGGQAEVFLTASGGGGQTGGGLIDGVVQVANSSMSVQATVGALTGGWARSRISVAGESRFLLTSGYSASMNSNLGVISGGQEVRINITNPTPVFFFIESSGSLSSNTSLTDGINTYPSGSTINPGEYTLLASMNANVFSSTQNPLSTSSGQLSAYFATPRCASPLAWSQRAQTGPAARYLASTAYDRTRSRIVLFGGGTSVPLVRYNDVWEWDGVSWLLRQADDPSAVNRPSPRRGAAIAYDSVGQRLYIFGGETNFGVNKEFWKLDPATGTWTNMSAGVPAGLSARWSQAMVFDRERNVCVLYGGSGSGPDPTDTWEFNPAGAGTWALKPSPTNPGPRSSPGMAFDTLRGRTVLFGGGSSTGLPVTDSPWVWDGAKWTNLTTNAGPTPRYGPGFAFDEARGRMVLLGGANNAFFNDTWELNGSTWTQLTTPPGLAPRASHSMVYDAAHGHILAFGGLNAALGYESDSWAFSWPQISQHPVNRMVSVGQTASFTVATSATATSFQWLKGATPISGATGATLQIPNCQASNAGSYSVIVGFPCGSQTSASATLTVTACYANCDLSTGSPLLTANDFVCFFGQFVAGNAYANCDGSTFVPVLTANDFVCFIDRYVTAVGCS